MGDLWLNHPLKSGASEGSQIKSTGESADKVLMSNGSGGASWQSAMTDAEVDDLFDVHKGDIIEMNLDGTKRQYLVLGKDRMNPVYTKVLGRFSLGSMAYSDGTTAQFSNGSNYLMFQGGTAESACAAWAATLSGTANNAIQNRYREQGLWYAGSTGSPSYIGKDTNTISYSVSKNNATLSDIWNFNKVEILSVQDIIDYLEVTTSMTRPDTTLNPTNLNKMFGITPGYDYYYYWLKDANADNTAKAMCYMPYNYSRGKIFGATYSISAEVYPTFNIDLSQVSYKEVAQ